MESPALAELRLGKEQDEPFVVEAFWTRQWIILDTVANDEKILDMP